MLSVYIGSSEALVHLKMCIPWLLFNIMVTFQHHVTHGHLFLRAEHLQRSWFAASHMGGGWSNIAGHTYSQGHVNKP